jgi:hypothetical protein
MLFDLAHTKSVIGRKLQKRLAAVCGEVSGSVAIEATGQRRMVGGVAHATARRGSPYIVAGFAGDAA